MHDLEWIVNKILLEYTDSGILADERLLETIKNIIAIFYILRTPGQERTREMYAKSVELFGEIFAELMLAAQDFDFSLLECLIDYRKRRSDMHE